MVRDFSVPSREVTNQTLPGREKLKYSRPGRALAAGDGKIDKHFLQCTRKYCFTTGLIQPWVLILYSCKLQKVIRKAELQ
jgi:hypothetical protein